MVNPNYQGLQGGCSHRHALLQNANCLTFFKSTKDFTLYANPKFLKALFLDQRLPNFHYRRHLSPQHDLVGDHDDVATERRWHQELCPRRTVSKQTRGMPRFLLASSLSPTNLLNK